jgi:hypothetical protein
MNDAPATENSRNENLSFNGRATRRSNHAMKNSELIERRSLLKAAAYVGLSTFAAIAPAVSGAAEENEIPAPAPEARLEDVLAGPNIKLTIERRRQIVLFGINRPYIQNRIDPETFEELAEAYYQYDHDPSLRAVGRTFQEGSTSKDSGRSQERASHGSRVTGR